MADLALKLSYFPVRAKGEAIRMMLRHYEVPFEDKIIMGGEFKELKPKLPAGQLPVLEVNGTEYPESGSILRTIGAITKSTPSDPVQFLKAESAYEISRSIEVVNPIVNVFNGDQLKEKYSVFCENLQKVLPYLSKALGDAEFYGGTSPCYADFGIWHFLDNSETVKPGAVTASNLIEWKKRVAALPRVKEYIEGRASLSEDRISAIKSLQA